MTVALQGIQVLLAHHAPIADKHHSREGKSLPQIGDHLLHRRRVEAVARPNLMSDRPAGDHHHANHDLYVLRLAVAAVTVLGEIFRAGALLK